ncbi:MAG TPA: SigB/SigF/SigG family RNA polymerase sigma factor [Actinospica sp.]|nr:SigB/SigF/SigG family RNA polymerase sigma factor [Actinospica sp.]
MNTATINAPGTRVGPAEREEQRDATMRVFRHMASLPTDDPERARLRDEVVADHMAYARHIARRYSRRRNAAVEDFEQVAYLGLIKAVDNFDPGHGTRFLGYATPMIVGEIKRYYRDATWCVHVPRHMQEVTGSLHKAADALTGELGRSPTLAELAGHLGVSQDEVVEALDASEAYRTASLDHPVGHEEEAASLGDLIGGDDPGYELTVDREVLRGLVARLCERDKRILLMRFFRGMTQAQIGEEIGISQMQVSRLITRILAELRAGFG